MIKNYLDKIEDTLGLTNIVYSNSKLVINRLWNDSQIVKPALETVFMFLDSAKEKESGRYAKRRGNSQTS